MQHPIWLTAALLLGLSKTVLALPVTELPVQSYEIEDPSEFNKQIISEIETTGDPWSFQPLYLTTRYLQGITGTAFIKQEIPPEEGREFPNKIVVTAIQDCYFDDSVRGEWAEILFIRYGDAWLIENVKRAYLCYRGDNTDSFQKEPCP